MLRGESRGSYRTTNARDAVFRHDNQIVFRGTWPTPSGCRADLFHIRKSKKQRGQERVHIILSLICRVV